MPRPRPRMAALVHIRMGERLHQRLIALAEADEVPTTEFIRRELQAACDREERRRREAASRELEHAA